METSAKWKTEVKEVSVKWKLKSFVAKYSIFIKGQTTRINISIHDPAIRRYTAITFSITLIHGIPYKTDNHISFPISSLTDLEITSKIIAAIFKQEKINLG